MQVTIDELMKMWTEDAVIDATEPGRELLRIPSIHSKYVRIMSHHNLLVKTLTTTYNKKKKIKWEYFSGDLNNPEDLETYGLEPWLKKLLRTDIPMYIDADKELTDILLKRAIHEEIVDFCKAVIRELNNRTYQLRSYIDYERFVGGQ